MITKTLVATALAVALAAACAQTPPPTPMPTNLTLDQAVQAALADASRRTGVAVEALQLLDAAAVTWRDGSLGCPQPGFVYTQALVPGFRVRVRVGGQAFDYHAGPRGPVVPCPAGRATEPLADDPRK